MYLGQKIQNPTVAGFWHHQKVGIKNQIFGALTSSQNSGV